MADMPTARTGSDLPKAFCWTRMGAESGENLGAIIRRKELERRLGSGAFFWGIGNGLGRGISALIQEVPQPRVLFSPIRGKARRVDATPARLVVWTRFENGGNLQRLPDHVLVTSRGDTPSGMAKRVHYALVCHATEALATSPHRHSLAIGKLENLATGKPVGFSQVTAVVRTRLDLDAPSSAVYQVNFSADLLDPYVARLGCPVLVPNELADELQDVSASASYDEWSRLVLSIRSNAERQLNSPPGSLF